MIIQDAYGQRFVQTLWYFYQNPPETPLVLNCTMSSEEQGVTFQGINGIYVFPRDIKRLGMEPRYIYPVIRVKDLVSRLRREAEFIESSDPVLAGTNTHPAEVYPSLFAEVEQQAATTE